jgi:mRNA-degrading endonuclease RelE of RelBE toxin-antitoxin system
VSYRVQVARPASRQLAVELPEAVAVACVEFIFGALAENPHRAESRPGPPFLDQWRARRGEYRVRYLIDEDQGVVSVIAIEHLRDVYRSP